jgi:dienelactone hydrolase
VKRVLILNSILALMINLLQAQKPLVEFNDNAWDRFSQSFISNDGEYVAYDTHQCSEWDLHIQSVVSSLKITVSRAELLTFTQDNKKVIFRRGDSIGILDVRRPDQPFFLTDIQSASVFRQGNDSDLLVYISKRLPDQLIVRHIESGREENYSSVKRYWPSNDGMIIVLEKAEGKTDTSPMDLQWLDTTRNLLFPIWSGIRAKDIQIGFHDSACVFTGEAIEDTSNNAVWIYQIGKEAAEKLVDNHDTSLRGLNIARISVFNDVSNRIFITLGISHTEEQASAESLASVDVWSYRDPVLKSAQLSQLNLRKDYGVFFKAVINVGNRQLIRLEYEDESISSELYKDKFMDCALLIRSSGVDRLEKNLKTVYLVNLSNGNRRLIADNVRDMGYLRYILSYNENYIFYYDQRLKEYFSYRIADGRTKNMTSGIGGRWAMEEKKDVPVGSYTSYPFAGVIKNEDVVLVYDQNDIFRLDPNSNGGIAQNLTGRQRRLRHWVFRLSPNSDIQAINGHDKLCIGVLDRMNKNACLSTICLEPIPTIGALNFEPYNFGYRAPIKARDKEVYVVTRMSVEEAPNLFYTNDFKQYTTITDIHPERKYNWMTSELVTWKSFEGNECQGILYKPENFDAVKRYPLLVYYYEQLSDNLHVFLYPAPSSGVLNIPYYVSHGYLVFEPDIHYRIGWPGRSAYNCVVSGVKSLTKRFYVDSKRIGLQGHSFGGFETNYIITHTTLFAAAMSASAVSDFVSGYGSVEQNGVNRQDRYEWGQSRIGGNLWQKPNLYIENSPVFYANRVETPLLLLSDHDDVIVPVQQGIEFFNALRRLGKRVWMLQYDGEGHNVFNSKSQQDLTMRMAQFFNYYLKGEAPPRWMTRPIPARQKGIDLGLEIDYSGVKP